MASLFFLITLISLLVFSIQLILAFGRHQRVGKPVLRLTAVVTIYSGIWIFCYFKQTNQSVALNTDICFDDWCATVTKIDTGGRFIVLQIKMSNHAKGIAQKPSEPSVQILDNTGHCWSFSPKAQQALEQQLGKQIPLDAKLELGQSLQTQMAFDIPKSARGLKVLIEEGPFITKLLFPKNRQVFLIN